MQVELTQAESQNIRIALIIAAKQPGVGEQDMTLLLQLSQKFVWKPDSSHTPPVKQENLENT